MDMDLKSFIGGCLGGFAGIISSYPFDTIKVRIQNQHISEAHYRGAIDCLKKTIQKESTHALYKGVSSPLIGSMFINAVCFGVEENVRKHYGNKDQAVLDKNSLEYYKLFAVSGAIAGLAQSIFLAPVELVKIKMQIPESKYSKTFECAKDLVKKGGPVYLMRGFQSTLIRDVPSVSTYFISFEYICNFFKNRQNNNQLSALSSSDHDSLPVKHILIAGGVAGCLSWLVTYPIDVIKTRFQADSSYTNYRDCLSKTYRSEGFMGFWRGLAPTLLRAFPNNAAIFATVVVFNRLVNRMQNDYNWDSIRTNTSSVLDDTENDLFIHRIENFTFTHANLK